MKRLCYNLLILLSFSFSQVEFYHDNNTIVIKNGNELTNPWAGGMNFCQFSKVDLNLDVITNTRPVANTIKPATNPKGVITFTIIFSKTNG